MLTFDKFAYKLRRCDCACPVCGIPNGEGSCTCGCLACTNTSIGYKPIASKASNSNNRGASNMPTLTESIDKLLKEYIRETITEGKGEPLIRRGIRKEKIETLLSLIQSTVKGGIEKKKTKQDFAKLSKDREKLGDINFNYVWGMYVGRNQAIDTITKNLKEKGII